MTNQLKMMVGVAVFAALTLAGTLGVFAFAAIQPVQADHGDPALVHPSRSFTPASGMVEMGGPLTVHIQRGDALSITETLPAGFTFGSHNLGDNGGHTVDGQKVTFTIVTGRSFDYTVMASQTAGSYTFAGTAAFDRTRANDRSVGGDTTVTVSASGGTTPMPTDLQVDALPRDPGAAAQVTVKFPIASDGLNIDESIVLEVGDDLGVPGSIAASNVSIADRDNTASPRSVVVETNSPDERFKITLFIGDMSDVDGAQDLMGGDITVTFRQEAGIKNRTEGGSDEWYYRTSRVDGLTQIEEDKIYEVPFLVKLSSYGDSRGEDITVRGLGFKNGTTVRFWRDADGMGDVDSNEDEVVLCSATASGDDIAECSFTLSNPPFKSEHGTAGDKNYINAIDGRNNTATMTGGYSLPMIKLEPSMSVNPKEGNPGDNVNVELYDFPVGGGVTQIQFGRNFNVCGGTNPAQSSCPSGTVGSDGDLSFSFEIPNGVTPGSQDLKIWASGANDNTTFAVGLGGLQLASTDVLPNQRIHVTGSGFTTSRGEASAYIGAAADIPNSSSCGNASGAVRLGGSQIAWDRINDGDAIEVTSGGSWSASIDLPVDSLTTRASTRELKVVDCKGGAATVDLTFPAREVTMSPTEGRVGSEVIITGKNFPAANDDSDSDVEITVAYKSGDEMDDDDVDPDGLGNFTVILEVPEDAGIPSNNTVEVQFTLDNGTTKVTETRTHRVPQGTINFGAASGAEGSLLTITAEGFARYTSVDEIMFGNRDITPSPKPSTGTTGDGEFDVRIPGADPGIYIIKVVIDKVTASQTFTVVSGSGVVDGSVESILANVMSEDALDRVFKFNNETKEWQWHINDPAFTSTNNLGGLSSGDLVWIKVSKTVTADVLGTSVTLSCINEGMENEDCWNQISIP